MRRRLPILIALAAVVVAGALWATGGGGVSTRQVDAFSAPGVTDPAGSQPGLSGTGTTTTTAVPGAAAAPPVTAVGGIDPPAPPPPIQVRSGVFTGEGRAIPEPVRLRIPSLGVDAPIDEVGYDPGLAEMEVPRSASVVGWYGFGPAPGDAGSAVLAAHVDWNGRPGPFFDLYSVTAGTRVEVEFADGSLQAFEITSLASYEKELLPTDGLFRRDGTALLTLITCGGEFDRRARSYRDNIVVQAVLVTPDSSPAPMISPG